MVDGPIQLILNPERFREQRLPAKGGGPGKDFFRGDDASFDAHRTQLAASILSAADGLADDSFLNLLVDMRPEAFAKSHRPFGLLFAAKRASHVGTIGYGEMVFSTCARIVREIADLVSSAETRVPWLTNARGVSVYSPSVARSEASAIGSISRWSADAQRDFTIEDAESWIAAGGGKLVVELFDLPRKRSVAREAIVRSAALVQGFASASETVVLSANGALLDAVEASNIRGISVLGSDPSIANVVREIEGRLAVKRLRLQEKLIQPDDVAPGPGEAGPALERLTATRPIVAVLDGGVIGPLTTFLAGSAPTIAPVHQSSATCDHATQVASLLRFGSSLNPALLDPEEDCDVYDIALFPDPQHMSLYYDGIDSIMEQLRAEVLQAKQAHSVRVVNISWNLRFAPGSPGYGLAAAALDSIAQDLDVIFVVSAGNLSESESRLEWPAREIDALAMIAQVTVPDGVASPSESIVNVAVGAINPPGLALEIEGAPTRYTRRGTSVPSTIKPNFGAAGGAAPSSRRAATGLKAMTGSGNVVDVRGTSFAAPVFARYLATLDHSIAGYVGRELLLALATHHASIPPILQSKAIRPLASSFVGHGTTPTAGETLEGASHVMTFVLDDTIAPKKRVELFFTWPDSLVNPNGSCRGNVRLTLVTRPVLNHAHGAEMVRVNLEAALRQAEPDGTFVSRTEATHEFFSGFRYANERTLATLLGKWFPVKTYTARMPHGRGKSSDWKLEVNYLTRAGEGFPDRGVAFALVLTIEDIDGRAPVFDEMKRSLASTGVRVNDLRTAVRVRSTV